MRNIEVTDQELEVLKKYRERKAEKAVDNATKPEFKLEDIKSGASKETLEQARSEIKRVLGEL